MNTAELVARVKLGFLDGEDVPSDEVINEMLTRVSDRIKIRMKSSGTLPDAAGSIIVEASTKSLRLRGYEGTTSESASEGGSVSNSFIDDVLSAYSEDLAALKEMMNARGIKFFK